MMKTREETALDTLKEAFAIKADPDKGIGMSKYMRNLFPFVGINSPDRKEISAQLRRVYKPQNASELKNWVDLLWEMPEREYQYVGMDYLQRDVKLLEPEDILWFEKVITRKSWWDTVDLVSGNYLGKFLKLHPQLFAETITRFSQNDNMWINRAAIICQLTYKQSTDTARLELAILPHITSKEFFLQKAIGWALRQYARSDAQWVLQFVAQHDLKPLSRREALKHLKDKTQ